MKAILKKSVKDSFWNYEDYDALTPNPITRALTNRYLPAWDHSPLKAMMMRRMGTVKQLYLYLDVKCDGDIIQSISLRCDLLDDYERTCQIAVDWDNILRCVEEYFHAIGYRCLHCTRDDDIVDFIQRLQQDIPLATEYFELINH